MLKSHTIFAKDEKEELMIVRKLESEGYQVKITDITETHKGGFAIQARDGSLRGTKWLKLQY